MMWYSRRKELAVAKKTSSAGSKTRRNAIAAVLQRHRNARAERKLRDRNLRMQEEATLRHEKILLDEQRARDEEGIHLQVAEAMRKVAEDEVQEQEPIENPPFFPCLVILNVRGSSSLMKDLVERIHSSCLERLSLELVCPPSSSRPTAVLSSSMLSIMLSNIGRLP